MTPTQLPPSGNDPAEAAEAAGLRYVSDGEPGFSRRRCGRGFTYFDVDGTTIPEGDTRRRLVALVIPPAWTDVWICPDPLGHLQVTGRDDRGRKQYLYHERWREARDATKFHRLGAFGHVLPSLRAAVDRDLRRHELGQPRVCGLVVALLDASLVRVGNDQYAKENGSHGLTTLRREHVGASTATARFRFPGKSGQDQDVVVRDRRLARQLHRLLDESEEDRVFTYDGGDGHRYLVDSEMVNDYVRERSGGEFTAKDFRTWGGTAEAVRVLHELDAPGDEREADAHVLTALDAAAERLGNTRAVARSSYVHPGVLERYLERGLSEAWPDTSRDGLEVHEEALLTVLEDGHVGMADAA